MILLKKGGKRPDNMSKHVSLLGLKVNRSIFNRHSWVKSKSTGCAHKGRCKRLTTWINSSSLYSICFLQIFLEHLFSFLKAFAMGIYLLKKSTILLCQNCTGLFLTSKFAFLQLYKILWSFLKSTSNLAMLFYSIVWPTSRLIKASTSPISPLATISSPLSPWKFRLTGLATSR